MTDFLLVSLTLLAMALICRLVLSAVSRLRVFRRTGRWKGR